MTCILSASSDWYLYIFRLSLAAALQDARFAEQPRPEGLAQSHIIGADFVAGVNSALMLGVNLFDGHNLLAMLRSAAAAQTGAGLFAYHVTDPDGYGIDAFDYSGCASSVEEKLRGPKSNWAVTGPYFYDEKEPEFAAGIEPSARGELESFDLNMENIQRREFRAEKSGHGFAWLDTGTPDSLLEAVEFMRALEKRTGSVSRSRRKSPSHRVGFPSGNCARWPNR